MRRSAGLLVSFAATPALAFSLAPANTSFVSSGHAAVSTGALSANCVVRFAGRTDAAGVGHISEAAFSGGPLGGCGGMHGVGLPWTMRAVAAGQGESSASSPSTPACSATARRATCR